MLERRRPKASCTAQLHIQPHILVYLASWRIKRLFPLRHPGRGISKELFMPDFFSNMAPIHSPTVATHPQPIHCAMDFRPELTIPLPLHVHHNLNLSQSATFEEPMEEGTVRTQHIKGVEFVWKKSGLCVNLPADE